jgi:hypothetical protein
MRRSVSWSCSWLVAVVPLLGWSAVQAEGSIVYKCPGNPVMYTDSITPKEAKEKGCTSLEGAPVTVIAPAKVKSGGAAPVPPAPAGGNTPRVDPADQKARDSDRKQIIAAELKKEESALAALKAEYNEGEPERRGDEKNFQKYLDRAAELKASIARKENDIAALKREIAKQP